MGAPRERQPSGGRLEYMATRRLFISKIYVKSVIQGREYRGFPNKKFLARRTHATSRVQLVLMDTLVDGVWRVTEVVVSSMCAAMAGMHSVATRGASSGEFRLVVAETAMLSIWAVVRTARTAVELVGRAASHTAAAAVVLEDFALQRCEAVFHAEQASKAALQVVADMRVAAAGLVGLQHPSRGAPILSDVPVGLPVVSGGPIAAKNSTVSRVASDCTNVSNLSWQDLTAHRAPVYSDASQACRELRMP